MTKESFIIWLIAKIILILVVFVALLLTIAFLIYAERKIIAFMQSRIGPNRVGPIGLLQPFADITKLFLKEDLIPAGADKFLFVLAPCISVFTAFMAFSVIPFGRDIVIHNVIIPLQITNLNVGVLFLMAIFAINVYGIVLAGWSSNSKYSLFGGMRSCAQMISYELPLGLSMVGILMLSHSLSLRSIVAAQSKHWFILMQMPAFIVFLISSIAETNRAPFDFPEAEPELVAGYHTEYSSFKFAMFFMAEYASMITLSALAVTLFFGGWLGPSFLPPFIWFFIKVCLMLFFFIWLRATYPRLRYDKLMKFQWTVLLPFSLLWILITGAILI
jgi:NADH-quinone oxidoreductase subunit H